MANDNNIKTFTAADIEKYHRGQLSPKEMHDLEKAALDDPFLADALEGYTTPGVHIDADIAELKRRLSEKTEEAKVIPMHVSGKSSFPWLRAAVMIVLIAGGALLSYQFLFNRKSTELANTTAAKPATEKAGDSVSPSQQVLPPDSNASASATERVTGQTTTTAGNTLSQPTYKKNGSIDIAIDTVKPSYRDDNTIALSATDPQKKELAGEHKDIPIASAPLQKLEENKLNTVDVKADDKKEMAADSEALTKQRNQALSKSANRRADNSNADGFIMRDVANQNKQSFSTRYFNGKVTDANNNPLPFANITNTTDNVGTFTDKDGKFTLVSPYDSVMNVQVKVLGYENSRIQLRSDMPTNQVKLQEDKTLTARILDTAKRNYAIRSRDANMTFEEPEPATGWETYDSYLVNNQLDIPEAVSIKKKTGNDAVELSFEVNKFGEPINIRIEKSLCEKCDQEAIRLIKEGPKWKRKAKKGKRTTVTVPFIKTE